MENTFYKKYLIKDGLVEYKKDNETLLIEKPVLDKSIKSIINKPVIITHDGENKVGEVVDAYYDIDTGNYIVGFNIWNEEAKKLLNNGYSISSTFEVINKEPATEKYHNIEYDNRVVDLEFINIAIVKEPRYQEAKQYVNSLDQDNIYKNGGAGSGNFGHKGRKGLVGGSSKYGSEDYSEKDLSEIAKRKETKGIINKKSIIKETIKNKVINKINNNKSLKERVEKFRKENFEKKETKKKEDIKEKDEVEYLSEEYERMTKEIDDLENKISKNREERKEIEKEFDKIPEATMTNYWERDKMGREIQHRLSAKEEESKEMISKVANLYYERSEMYKKIQEAKKKKEKEQDYSDLQRDLDIKNFLQEKAINGYSLFKIAKTIKSIEEKLQDKSIFGYNKKQKKQAEQDLKELKDFVNSNKYIELREEFEKKFGKKDIDFYLDYEKGVDNKNNQNLNKAIKEVKTKANETYKNNGYDIEKDNSSYYFKDMKKKAILKYGKLENILNRDLDISNFESIAPYYSDIQNNSLTPLFTYWQSPDGKVKRVYYKLYSQGEEIKSGYEPIDDVFEDYITGNLKDDEKTKLVKDIRKMRKNKI